MKRILALTIAMLMLFASVAGAEGMTLIGDTKKNTIKLNASYPANPVMDAVSPTTGLNASGEAYTPILMVLDNAEDAYPHWGVSQADILFQVPNAGSGATKLMALFADNYPELAGGARSARGSMVPLAMAWDAAFAFAGGPELDNNNVDPSKLMSKFGMWKAGLGFNLLGSYSQREDFVKNPHNLSAQIRAIHEELVADGVEFTKHPFYFTSEPRTEGADASYIEILHYGDDKENGSNSASASSFTYDADKAAYIRTNSSGEYVDRDTGDVVPFANVIVLRVKFQWNTNYVYLKDHLVGEGVAEIFQNGKYVRGAWVRSAQTDRIVFVGPDGEELAMQRGKTFIIITNDVTDVSYR